MTERKSTMRPVGEIAAEVIAKTRQSARTEADRATAKTEREKRVVGQFEG
jgi:hypothetical protein